MLHYVHQLVANCGPDPELWYNNSSFFDFTWCELTQMMSFVFFVILKLPNIAVFFPTLEADKRWDSICNKIKTEKRNQRIFGFLVLTVSLKQKLVTCIKMTVSDSFSKYDYVLTVVHETENKSLAPPAAPKAICKNPQPPNQNNQSEQENLTASSAHAAGSSPPWRMP